MQNQNTNHVSADEEQHHYQLQPFKKEIWGENYNNEVKYGTPKNPQQRKPKLFTPFKLRGVTFKNRIMVSPMCQYSAIDGFPNDWHLVHLGTFAKGGAAIVMFEATGVLPEGRITPWDLGLWKDEQIASYKRIVEFIHTHDSVAAIQLAHAGRKASRFPPFKHYKTPDGYFPHEKGGWTPLAPSSEAYHEDGALPHELTKEEIKDVIRGFVEATRRADEAGFDVVEIHAAHGYLISTFYSPNSNKRTDEYGGDLNGRCRFAVEVSQAVRAVWPAHKPLFVRLSCKEWKEGGWSLEDSVILSKLLKDVGVDLIDCSSSAISPGEKLEVGPGYQVPFSETIKHSAEIPTVAVGLITQSQQAEEIIFNSRSDIVAIGRELLRDPFWPMRVAKEFSFPLHAPSQLERAFL